MTVSDATSVPPPVTSVAVTDRSHVTLRPLGTEHVRIEAGFWADRQQRNRDVTIPAGYEQLERAGNLDNLRTVAGRASTPYRGLLFNDSDVYKWLEAAGWELAREGSAELERRAGETIELVEAAQGEDGYLNSYFTLVEPRSRFANPQMGHELYCAGHLVQAAVAQARATGDRALLGVAQRFADHLHRRFGPGRRPYVEGHPEIEMALVELYRLTGERRHLELAVHLIDQRGHGWLGPGTFGAAYYQDHEPVRSATAVIGHAVRALYLAAGVTDASIETGDEGLLAAMTRQWEDMVAHKTYLTGAVGSRHRDEAFGDPYELPPDRAYGETCAAIASILWSWRLLLATGEARYADLIERTLYNGFAASTSLDGRRFFYVNPLQVRSARETRANQRGGAGRREWFECACCPPNIMRLLSSLNHYLATVDDTGVQLHQYVSGTIRTAGAGGPDVVLQLRTDYPWDGRVDVVVDDPGAQDWTLGLRVPAWSADTRIGLNGAELPLDRDRRGYVAVRRRWRAGDKVTVELDMSPRLVAPHPRIDAVRGCLAVERGPLVHCLEQADLPDGVELDDVRLAADPDLTATPRPDLLGGVVAVRARGVVRPTTSWSWPYGPAAAGDAGTAREVDLLAVPYHAWANRGPNAMRVWVPRA
jgi:DUF1680 family protein